MKVRQEVQLLPMFVVESMEACDTHERLHAMIETLAGRIAPHAVTVD